jgi:hypothetical protein
LRLKNVGQWSSFEKAGLEQRGEGNLLTVNPKLLRRGSRRFARRLVFLCALAVVLLVAPSAGGAPGPGEAPHVTPIYLGSLGANGWYLSNLTLSWKIETHPDWPIRNSSPDCNTRTITAETTGVTFTCWAENDAGRTTVTTKVIKIDKTAPSVVTVLERQPDANGWYNRPVTFAFVGTDVTAGIAGCSSTRYAGPDSVQAVVGGSCTDNAGNVAGASFPFKYDATAPTVFAATAKLGNRSADLAWRASDDTRLVQVLRAPGRDGQGESVVYEGTATGFRDTGLAVGRTYEYRVTGIDDAMNRAQQAIKIVATGALLSPAPASHVSLKSPPRLIWTPVKRASYYNLQLIRGRKVLSAWPARPGFQLRRTWIYRGRRYKLRPGVYRWYVWPGIGRISAGRFGPRLGSSTFVVTK